MMSIFVLLLSLSALADDAPPADGAGSQDEDTGAGTDDDASEVMVITGSRTETPLSQAVVTTDVVTAEDIRASGATDASQVLETWPGVEIHQSFRGDAIQMQGMDSEYVLVLINGQRIPGRRDGVIDLSRIPAERIERIEVVKGAAGALYGSEAMGGVINIILREPERPLSAETYASYGSRHTVHASETVGVKHDDGAATVGLGWHSNDGYDWDPSDAQTDGNAVQQLSLDAGLTHKLSAATRAHLDGAYIRRDSRGVDTYQAAAFDRRKLTEDASARGGVEVLAGDGAKLKANGLYSLFRDQTANDQQGSDALDSYEESVESLAELDLQWDQVLPAQNLATLGAEITRETLTSPRLTADGQRWRYAAYLQDEWRVGARKQLSVMPGGRVDVDTWFGTHGTPRLALRYDPIEDFALRLSAGLGFRAPSFREMYLLYENPSAGYMVEGNPDLKPETSRQLSLGVELRPQEHLRLRVDGFHNDLDDMIDFALVEAGTTASPDRYAYRNVAQAMTEGVEADARLAWPWITTDLSYTYTRTLDRSTGLPLELRAPHRATFGLTVRNRVWGSSATLRGQVLGPTRFYEEYDDDGNPIPFDADPYADLKVRLEQRVLPGRLRAFAGVDNLTNAGDALYIHLDPRTFYGGLVFNAPRND